MNILVAGGYDTQNLGDYASFLGLSKVLTAQIPDCRFTVLSRHPHDEFARQFGVKMLPNLDHQSKADSQGRIFFGFNEGDDCQHLESIHRALIDADCLVLGNGRLFVDISLGFMKGPLSYYAMLVSWAKLLNKPVILSSVTLVHPETELGKQYLRFILENAKAILVRESFSLEVAKHYCVSHKKIKLLPDIAFALDKSDVGDIESPLVIAKPTIGVTFRGVDYATTVGQQTIADMAQKLSAFLERNDYNAVLIPQCTYDIDTPATDDRQANKAVYETLSPEYRRRCTLITNKLSLKQTLKLYQELDYVFTSRRHGFIMALTQGTQASLVCKERNTRVVQQIIDIPELYLDASDEYSQPANLMSELSPIVNQLKAECSEYTSCFIETCGHERCQ